MGYKKIVLPLEIALLLSITIRWMMCKASDVCYCTSLGLDADNAPARVGAKPRKVHGRRAGVNADDPPADPWFGSQGRTVLLPHSCPCLPRNEN
jgi:hypothetical protein